MRVNIYAEELTERVELIQKEIEGHTYTAVRFYLELPATVDGQQFQGPFMHHPGDDDSSAVTFWGKQDLRSLLRKALNLLDQHYEARRGKYHEYDLCICGHEWGVHFDAPPHDCGETRSCHCKAFSLAGGKTEGL